LIEFRRLPRVLSTRCQPERSPIRRLKSSQADQTVLIGSYLLMFSEEYDRYQFFSNNIWEAQQ